MNNQQQDFADIKAFAEIRAMSGHEDCFVYQDGASYRFGPAPKSALQFNCLLYMGGQGLN